MKKIKLFKFLIIILGLFFAQNQELLGAFTFQTVCQPPLTRFSEGGSTFGISFPPGGGTTCDNIADCPKISIPEGSDIFSIKMDLELSDPASEIGTPYIWIPVSSQHKLAQLKTSDGSLVHIFSNSNDNCNPSAFSNPSRITVIPGGDVWVGNRNAASVTRLGIKIGCIEDGDSDCYECKGTYPTCGSDVRGVTFDSEGNIWAGGDGSSCLVRLCGHNNCVDVNGISGYNIGDKMDINSGGGTSISTRVYGLIADIYGYVWTSGGNSGDVVGHVDITDNTGSISTLATGNVYGIGIDNEGDIWIGKHGDTDIWEIDGADSGGVGIGVKENTCATTSTNTGLAVDRTNNVWSTGYSLNRLYVVKDGNCADLFTKTKKADGTNGVCTWAQPHGMAVDFDNHAWLICDTGEAVKYAFHDDGDGIKLDDGEDDIEELQRINLCTLGGCANASGSTYNYSDMTGLRTSPITVNMGSSGKIPLGASGSITLCTDGIEDCTMPGSNTTSCNNIGLSPVSCASPSASGKCEFSLNIFSASAGEYTLKNLEVVYGKQIPVTTGGLVPCGRDWNDPVTLWNDKESCRLCHSVIFASLIINFLMEVVILISILALIVAGLIYVKTGGDLSLITAAKQNVNKILYGFVIVFVAWAIINLIMILLGFNDPIGDGSWKIFNCEVF